MIQLFKHKYTEGRTIKKMILPDESRKMWISFTDDTFIVFEIDNIAGGFDYDRFVIVTDKYTKDSTNIELVELGFITKKEHEIALKKQHDEYLERCRLYDIEQEERNRKYELEQLEKLKKKYDNNN